MQLATERATEADLQALSELLEQEEDLLREETFVHSHAFHLHVARMTRNPSLELFVQSLTDLTGEMARRIDDDVTDATRRASHEAHVRIAAAIVDGDPAQGRRRLELHVNAMQDWAQGGAVGPE